MSKPQTKPESVTQAVFDLVNQVRHHLQQWGMTTSVRVSRDDETQMFVIPQFSLNDLIAHGIDPYDLPSVDGAWCDWFSAGAIVVGDNHSPEPGNQDDHDDLSTVHIAPARPLPAINLDFDA